MQPYVLIRLKQATPHISVGGRLLGHHSQFGNLHALRAADALRLVENGKAKLLPQFRRDILRAEVAAARDARCTA